MPQGPTGRYYWEDHNTGESGEMPWSADRDPTDYEIDSYRARSSAPDTSTFGGWLSDKLPDPVEDAWEWANKPISDAPSRWARSLQDYIPKELGLGAARPAAQFIGDTASSMTSPLNLALTAVSGGAWGAGRLGLARTAGALSGIEMGAGAGQVGLGGYHLSQADTMPEAAGAGLEMLFGGLGYAGGKAGRAAHAPDVPGPMPDPFATKPGVIDNPARMLGPGARFEGGPGGIGEIAPPAPPPPRPPRESFPTQRGSLDSVAPEGTQFGGGVVDPADPYLGAGLGTGEVPSGGIEIAGLGDVAAPELPLQQPVHPRGPSALRPFEQDAGIWQQMNEPLPGQAADLGALEPPGPVRPAQDFWREEIGRPPEMTPGPVDTPHPADLAAVTDDIELSQRGVPDVDSPALQEATVAAMAAEEAAPAPAGPRVGQPPAPRTAAEAQAYVQSLGQRPELPTPIVPPARDALARVAMVADQPTTPKPLVRPAKPKAPTPDRMLTLGRGVHDAVRVTFPDKLHADLFSAFGRMKKQIRGEKAISPDFEGLAARMGMSVKEVSRIASEYRNKILAMKNELPEYAPEGDNVLHMEAPHWGGKAAEMVPAAPAPPPAQVPPTPPPSPAIGPGKLRIRSEATMEGGNRVWINDEEFTNRFGPGGPTQHDIQRLHAQARDPASFRRLAELKGEEYIDFAPPLQPELPPPAALKAELKSLGAAPEKPKVTQTAKLPKSKSVRVSAVMDELVTLGPAEMQAISNDPARLLAAAKAAGIKSTTLKSAMQEWFQKIGGPETGGLKVGPSDKRMAQLKKVIGLKGGVAAFPSKAANLFEVTKEIAKVADSPNSEHALAGMMQRGKDLIREGIGKVKTLDQRDALDRKLGQLRTDFNELESLAKRTQDVNAAEMYHQLSNEVLDGMAEIRKIQKADDARFGMGKVQPLSEMRGSSEGGRTLPPRKPESTKPKTPEKPELKLVKSNIQEWFKTAGGSEKGALGLPSKAQLQKGFEKSFDVANSLRMTSLLSGLAPAKSFAGNFGAHLAAALEGRTLKPLKVLGNMKAISRDLKSGWQAGANPALTQGFNKANLPGRAMGAGDFAGIESLKRAGLSEKDAKELMLTGANQISSWWPLETRLGKLLVPFRTTPFNQFAQGITRWKKHPDVAAAAMILGGISGANVDSMEGISMISAFAGPYAIPFLVGAWAASGKAEMLNQISPMPEWGITKTITNPFGAFTESPGKRWFRPGLGFGAEAEKEKKRENLERRRAKRRAAAGLD